MLLSEIRRLDRCASCHPRRPFRNASLLLSLLFRRACLLALLFASYACSSPEVFLLEVESKGQIVVSVSDSLEGREWERLWPFARPVFGHPGSSFFGRYQVSAPPRWIHLSSPDGEGVLQFVGKSDGEFAYGCSCGEFSVVGRWRKVGLDRDAHAQGAVVFVEDHGREELMFLVGIDARDFSFLLTHDCGGCGFAGDLHWLDGHQP